MALGEKLRNAREQRGLTTSQVAEATRLMVQQVEELEREDFHRVAAPIYGKGFIKLYAEFVGIDPAPLVSEFQELFTGTRRPPVARRGAPTVAPPTRVPHTPAAEPEHPAAAAAEPEPPPSAPARPTQPSAHASLQTPVAEPPAAEPPARTAAQTAADNPPIAATDQQVDTPADLSPTLPVSQPVETPAALPAEALGEAPSAEDEVGEQPDTAESETADDADLFTLAAQRAFAGQPVAQVEREPTRNGDPLPGRVRPRTPTASLRAPHVPASPAVSADRPFRASPLEKSWQHLTHFSAHLARLARRSADALPAGWSWPIVGVATAAILVVAALVTFGVMQVVQHARRPAATPLPVHTRVLPPPAPYMD